jgi:hypothetical protein
MEDEMGDSCSMRGDIENSYNILPRQRKQTYF